MNIPTLLTLTLQRIRKDFYTGRDNDFHRDYIALTKALARYGCECAKRGWHLEPRAIFQDLHKLLTRVLPRRDEIEYLPVYLESTIRSHVGYRSEEIQRQASMTKVQRSITVTMEGLTPVAKVVPTTTELLAELHASLKRRKKPAPAPKPQTAQLAFAL
jgi:hypothetical protein